MNIANKLTMIRIFLTVVLITLLLFPFYMVNIDFPKFIIGTITVDLKYIIAAIIFAIASITDFWMVILQESIIWLLILEKWLMLLRIKC